MSDFNFYEALQKLKKSGDTEAAARKEVGIKSDPWLIAKKNALVDAPASILGLAGLVETGVRHALKSVPLPVDTSASIFDANKAADVFAGAAERAGLLPEGSRQLQPHGIAERAAGVGARVLANPLSFIPGGQGARVAGLTRNVVGGLGGEAAAEAVSAQGGGGLAQTGAGFAADAALMALSPKARAGFGVSRLNLGPEGAVDVERALGSKFDDLTDAEKALWNQFEQSTSGTTMPSDVLRDVGEQIEDTTKYAPTATRPEVAGTVIRRTPDEIGVPELQRIRAAAREEATQASLDAVPKKSIARNAGIIRNTADAMIDVIAQASPEDAEAVARLKLARGATKRRAEAFPQESALYRSFFGGKARTNSQEVVGVLLSSPQRKTEIGLVLRGLEGSPSAQRGFRRAFVQAVLNAPEELAGRAGATGLRKLDRYSDVSSAVLGKKGAAQLRKRLADAALGSSASNDATLALARQAGIPWPIARMLGGGAAAAGAAMAAGASSGAALRAGAVGSVVLPAMVFVSEKFGPRAARDIALESLLDPELYAAITRKIGGRTIPDYTKDLERAVVTRGLHLGLPDAQPAQEPSLHLRPNPALPDRFDMKRGTR